MWECGGLRQGTALMFLPFTSWKVKTYGPRWTHGFPLLMQLSNKDRRAEWLRPHSLTVTLKQSDGDLSTNRTDVTGPLWESGLTSEALITSAGLWFASSRFLWLFASIVCVDTFVFIISQAKQYIFLTLFLVTFYNTACNLPTIYPQIHSQVWLKQ